MATILDGKALAEDILEIVRRGVERMESVYNVTPGLAIISFGETSGQVYVKNKKKTCERLGIYCEHHEFDFTEGTDIQEDVEELIEDLNGRDDIHGIIVQLPIPDEFDICPVCLIDKIKPEKDVDGLTTYNTGALWRNCYGGYHTPCTPLGIMTLLRHYDIPLEGKKVCIVGRSDLVGKPLAAMMMEENATVTLCHSKSAREDIAMEITGADIVVCAVGNPDVMREYYIGGSVVVDVGINRVDGKIVGDIPEEDLKYTEAYTPVPGGVGPMTVAMLMQNVCHAADYYHISRDIERALEDICAEINEGEN